jgi:hypothetical protein
MYLWLWRRLPGPPPAKLLQVLALAAGVVALCFLWLFPAIAPVVPFNQGTISLSE